VATGLTLLGFLPASELRWDLNVETALFLYPEEVEYKGSTATFIALHAAMLERDCMAWVALRRHAKSAPKLGEDHDNGGGDDVDRY
jgi:ATP-dependent DNA helicase 2 subunit 1